MKIAALYDIHANLPALEAVLAEIEPNGVDAFVIGGDALGGPLAMETLARLQRISVPTYFIHGNHESEVLRYIDTGKAGGLTPVADREAQRVAGLLSAENEAFIRTWATTIEIDVDGLGRVLFCHANPQDDITVFTAQTPAERVMTVLGKFNADLIVCGHTHMQFDRQVGSVRVVNAGSVGMPFGRKGAHWLLLDGGVQFKHTPYDYEQAAAQLLASGPPDVENFINGNLLSVPSQTDAFAFLHKIEAMQQAE